MTASGNFSRKTHPKGLKKKNMYLYHCTCIINLWRSAYNICLFISIVSLSRSGDSTVRIWSIAERINRSSIQSGPSNVLVLKHAKGKASDRNKDITTLDWNVSVIIVYGLFS